MIPEKPSPTKGQESGPVERPGDQPASTAARHDSPASRPEEALAPPQAGKEEEYILFAFDQDEHPFPFSNEMNAKKGGWIISFADLMTLLLCAFILLFASSRLDLEKFRLIAQSMSGALGGKSVIYVPVSAEDIPKIARKEESDMTGRLRRTLGYANQLRTVLAPEIQQRQLDIEVSDQLITILILQNGSFETGSSTLNPNFLPTARKIRDALVDVPGDITVAGHSDNQPMSGGKFRSNWELSSARAFSLMHELLQDNVLPNERFVLKGCGDTQPRVPNTTQDNREKNRRVEIIIDQRGLKDNPELFPVR
ncbi:MAG: OmpA family protein [Desulfobulbaceae bacterium]|nr:OmpA family protein [Desulfobulbaceae bacterium]HIJ89527.1 OmpA family protein [Deltaproteobacteria bacterium]